MSLRGPVPTPTTEARRAEFTDWMGWDGMGWDGMEWDGIVWAVIKSVLQISLYFVGI